MTRVPVLVLLVTLLAACGSTENSVGQLRIHGVSYLGDLPTLVADKRGFFEAEGLEATVVYRLSGKENLQLLRRGETDFALMALTPLVIDALNDATPGQGDDPVILANLANATNINQVVSLTRSGFDHLADLRHGRVGLVKGTNAEFAWWLFATYHGLNPTAVQQVDLPVEGLGEALMAGEIDAAVLWEPWITRLHQRTGESARVHAGSQVYTSKWVLVARGETVATREDETRALLDAYSAAIGFIGASPSETLALYNDSTGVSTDALQQLRQRVFFELNLDWSLVSTLQQQIEWAQSAGHAVPGSAVDVLSLIETEPLRSVAPAAVGLTMPEPGSVPVEN